jgi:hypothetical protein
MINNADGKLKTCVGGQVSVWGQMNAVFSQCMGAYDVTPPCRFQVGTAFITTDTDQWDSFWVKTRG